MGRIFLLCVLLFAFLKSNAQIESGFEIQGADSVQQDMERRLMYHELLTGNTDSDIFPESFGLPDFNFQQELMKRWNSNLSLMNFNSDVVDGFSPGMIYSTPSPFYTNGMIFSSAKHRLNDKFVIGGYSFGVNSIFSAPLPNQFGNSFDVRGSTFFMQYKVSKKIKIETRVNVSGQRGPGY